MTASPTERSTTELAIDAVRAQGFWDLADHLAEIETGSLNPGPARERALVNAGAVGYLRETAAAMHPYFADELRKRTS